MSAAASDNGGCAAAYNLVRTSLCFTFAQLPDILPTMHSSGNSIPGAQTFTNGWAPYFRCLEQPCLASGSQEFAPGSQKPAPADNRSLYPQMAPDLNWGCLLYSRATYPSCLSHRMWPWLPVVLVSTNRTPGSCCNASWLLAFYRPSAWPMHALPQSTGVFCPFAGGCSTCCLLR